MAASSRRPWPHPATLQPGARGKHLVIHQHRNGETLSRHECPYLRRLASGKGAGVTSVILTGWDATHPPPPPPGEDWHKVGASVVLYRSKDLTVRRHVDDHRRRIEKCGCQRRRECSAGGCPGARERLLLPVDSLIWELEVALLNPGKVAGVMSPCPQCTAAVGVVYLGPGTDPYSATPATLRCYPNGHVLPDDLRRSITWLPGSPNGWERYQDAHRSPVAKRAAQLRKLLAGILKRFPRGARGRPVPRDGMLSVLAARRRRGQRTAAAFEKPRALALALAAVQIQDAIPRRGEDGPKRFDTKLLRRRASRVFGKSPSTS